MTEQIHGGRAAAGALVDLGVSHVFTLSGGRIFPLLDGCTQEGIRLVDVRHEQTAGYGAEGWGRLTRSVGVAAVTAGPGVTNVMSPLAQAGANRAPVVILAGRAPAYRWGQGSLQEIDHVRFVAPLAEAGTVAQTDAIHDEVTRAARSAMDPPRGPRFLDFPLDVLFNATALDAPRPPAAPRAVAPPDGLERVAAAIEKSERPVIVAGTSVWLDRAEDHLRALAESARIPVYMNGGGRGCLPADHELAFSWSRSYSLRRADLVVVVGAPLDFRLSFGAFGGAEVVHLDSAPELIAGHAELEASVGGPLDVSLGALARAAVRGDRAEWLGALRAVEAEKQEAAEGDLRSPTVPIHPMRVYEARAPARTRRGRYRRRRRLRILRGP